MARDTESIERDIERAREELATTLDELAARPKRMADSVKETVMTTLQKPAVQYGLIGTGVAVVGAVVIKVVR